MLRKSIYFVIFSQVFLLGSSLSCAQEIEKPKEQELDSTSWLASPNNWMNSKYNTENTPFNFANSVKNFANREDSPSRINIINTLGFVVGYAVVKPDGGVNYFSEEGERIGYSPDGGVSQFDVDGDPETFRTRVGKEK